jgi:hypothetical protein
MSVIVSGKCGCGVEFKTHNCTLDWTGKVIPTFTLQQVRQALHFAMGGIVPQYLWDAMTEELESMHDASEAPQEASEAMDVGSGT